MRTSPGLVVVSTLCGTATLALELVWARQLTVVFGASHFAVTTVLAAFMLGLGFGSWFGGRWADGGGRLLRHLAAVQLLLAVLTPILTVILAKFPSWAALLVPSLSITHPAAICLRFILALTVMLPGTLLMGAVFPIMTRAATTETNRFHASLGWLYATNTLGGLFGVVVVVFLLLPTYGTPAVIGMVSILSAAGAAVAFWAANSTPQIEPPSEDQARVPTPLTLLACSFMSGAVVIGGETVWNRCLGIVLPNSTYTFALLLAIYLAGLGIGGFLASRALTRPHPLTAWATLQSAAGFWAAGSLVFLPFVAVAVRQMRPDFGWARVLVTPLGLGSVLILPMTLILGAAWPLLLAAATPRIGDGGRRIGILGLTNAVGAALGAATTGWVILPNVGFGRTLLLLASLHAGMAAVGFRISRRKMPFRITANACTALLLAAVVLPRFGQISLPSTTLMQEKPETISYRESATGTVTVLEYPDTGARSMYVDNNAVIGTTFDALKVVRMLGLLPALIHPEPSRALVIGYGAGVTTSILNAIPGVEHIDVVEIIPAVVAESHHFENINHAVVDSPKVDIKMGDGRNHLLLTRDMWDVITCDPVHPLYGSAGLYSADFFTLCRKRLRPGGLMFQYLPLHHMPPEAFRRAIFTFQTVFTEVRVLFSLGHAVLVGSDTPITLNWDRWQTRLASFEHPEDLVDSVLDTPEQIAALFQLDTKACLQIGLAPASTDTMPFLEFLEPRAYDIENWQLNARSLIELYSSPVDEIRGFPSEKKNDFMRLVAGKRLLLFSQLELTAQNTAAARDWLEKAIQISPDDPEIIRFAVRPSPR